ncbi:Deoxycytidine monophosphate (dCMP) deaminase [Ceratobasidium sp. 395]|nr:Deoxycytidine monophosphate (dCMP) deaminase [Ceratobasidium sp. 395]
MLRSCAQRPFFILISVDAPILTRWERYKKRRPPSSVSLEEFIQQSDMERFGPQADSTRDPLNEILKALPHVSVTNNFSSLPELHAHLDSLALRSTERVRPGWDDYFMLLASLASLRSTTELRADFSTAMKADANDAMAQPEAERRTIRVYAYTLRKTLCSKLGMTGLEKTQLCTVTRAPVYDVRSRSSSRE